MNKSKQSKQINQNNTNKANKHKKIKSCVSLVTLLNFHRAATETIATKQDSLRNTMKQKELDATRITLEKYENFLNDLNNRVFAHLASCTHTQCTTLSKSGLITKITN